MRSVHSARTLRTNLSAYALARGVRGGVLTTETTPGRTGPALVDYADREGDLLIVGAGRRSPLRWLRGDVAAAHCVGHARCAVLVVPLPTLAREVRPRAFARMIQRADLAAKLVQKR